MNPTMLCPACLAELPADYPFDHVVIDRALTSQPERLATMRRQERREVLLTGLARGMTITALTRHFGWSTRQLRALLPADHFESEVNARKRHDAEREQLEATIRSLWEQRLPDTDIALRTGRTVYVVADVRRRLGLATLPSRHLLFRGAR
jgi:hypothetical protein